MHTPRTFDPSMFLYSYSGLSSTEHKDAVCHAITSGAMPYAGCLQAVHACALELRNTFNEIGRLDGAFAAHAHRMVRLLYFLDEQKSITGLYPAEKERVLYDIIHRLYDALYACVTENSNEDAARFRDPSFVGHGVHLQIAKACSILVNAIAIANCCARTVVMRSVSAVGEREEDDPFLARLALTTYANIRFAAIRRCLNSASGSEDRERRKAILRMVQHNTELARKISELVEPAMPDHFRSRTESCLKKILDVIETRSAACQVMVLGDDIAQLRLSLATEARIVLSNNLDRYVGRTGVGSAAQTSPSMCVNALIKALGCTLLVYREYAASESANHPFAGSLEQCIRILRDDVCPGVLSHECTGEGGSSLAHRVCLHLDRTTDELAAISPELLINPQVSGKLHKMALRYLAEASCAWKSANREHFSVPEEGESSSIQPSTSGLASTSAGVGGAQASYTPTPPRDPGVMPHAYAQPSTSYAQPSTSAGVSSSLGELQVASHRAQTPSDDEP